MIPTANIQNFLFTSRYPPDKIVAIYTGSFSAIASTNTFQSARTNTTINHLFGDSLLLQTTYSLDGGTTWQDQDTAIPNLATPSQPIFDTLYVNAYSTTTTVVIVVANFFTSAKTVTYKVVAMSKT